MSLSFLRDREFIRSMLALALPVAIQQLITASLNMIDVLMVSQLGETSVAALGLANQIFFLLILFLFGVTSGMSIFTAQYWGKGDVENIRKVLGICLAIAVAVAAAFTLAATLIPQRLMSFYTEDQAVIQLGSDYLRIVGLSYIPMAITVSYIAVLRSITFVKITVIVSVLALGAKNPPCLFTDLWGRLLSRARRTRRCHWHGSRLGIRMYPSDRPCLRLTDSPGCESAFLFSVRPSVCNERAQNVDARRDQRSPVVGGNHFL